MEENLNQDAEFLERVLKRMPTLFFFNGHRNDAIFHKCSSWNNTWQ